MTARQRRATSLAVLVVLAAGLLAAAPAPAASREELARADALFVEGRRLLEAGALAVACARFQESNVLAPRGGTVLNLGLCLEQLGDLGGARAALQTALARAAEDGRTDRVPIARAHLAAVEDRMARAAAESLRQRLVSAEALLGRGQAASACALVQAAVAEAPAAPALWRFLGRCHMRLRQVEQAQASFRKYLELDPNAGDAGAVRAIVGDVAP